MTAKAAQVASGDDAMTARIGVVALVAASSMLFVALLFAWAFIRPEVAAWPPAPVKILGAAALGSALLTAALLWAARRRPRLSALAALFAGLYFAAQGAAAWAVGAAALGATASAAYLFALLAHAAIAAVGAVAILRILPAAWAGRPIALRAGTWAGFWTWSAAAWALLHGAMCWG